MNDYNYMLDYYQNLNGYNKNISNEPIKLDSNKGFLRGNMFDDLYDPYKNYMPVELKQGSEFDNLLQKVQQYNFAMTDLNLYLDNYPNDAEVIKIFNNYRNMYLSAVSNFEKIYGPLDITNNPVNVNTWVWDKNPWPWEVQS